MLPPQRPFSLSFAVTYFANSRRWILFPDVNRGIFSPSLHVHVEHTEISQRARHEFYWASLKIIVSPVNRVQCPILFTTTRNKKLLIPLRGRITSPRNAMCRKLSEILGAITVHACARHTRGYMYIDTRSSRSTMRASITFTSQWKIFLREFVRMIPWEWSRSIIQPEQLISRFVSISRVFWVCSLNKVDHEYRGNNKLSFLENRS